jgi:hypothetical protein
MKRAPITSTYDVRKIAHEWIDDAERYLPQNPAETDLALATSDHVHIAAVDTLYAVISYVMLWEPNAVREDRHVRRDVLAIARMLFSEVDGDVGPYLDPASRPGSALRGVSDSLELWGASQGTDEPLQWLTRFIVLAPAERAVAGRKVSFIVHPCPEFLDARE